MFQNPALANPTYDVWQAFEQCYSTNNYEVQGNAMAVANPFISNLYTLCQNEAMTNLRILRIVQRNGMTNRGEVAQKGVSAADKSVLDVCKLTPLLQYAPLEAHTVVDEVAYFRIKSLGLDRNPQVDEKWMKAHSMLLFLDYMLGSCLCYVESFKGIRADKFFATRNSRVLMTAVGMPISDVGKYTSYLTASVDDYAADRLTMLKVVTGAKGVRVGQPRTPFTIDTKINITPLFFMHIWRDALVKAMGLGVVHCAYTKDNGQLREMYATLNPTLLNEAYKDINLVQTFLAGVDLQKIDRGYIKVPEFGISRYDEGGCRSLNLSRITSVQFVHPDQVDLSFVDVDLGVTESTFIATIERVSVDSSLLNMMYTTCVGRNVAPAMTQGDVKKSLYDWFNTNKTIGSTTFMRQLHKLMVANPLIFGVYTGMPTTYSGATANGFTIGVQDFEF